MKCLVPVKRVIDAYVKIRIKQDQTGVETDNVKMSMDPFDEIAIEEAVRLKEQGLCTEIIAVSIGSQQVQETLRQALARGADKAILIETEEEINPLTVAKFLKACVEKEQPKLVLMGKQAIDSDNNQTGQMLAAILGWAQGTFISKLSVDAEQETVQVVREIDGGLETLKLKLPAILTTDLRLNEPRYISLPNVMRAKSKPLEVLQASSFDINMPHSVKTLKVMAPEERTAGVKVETVVELVELLKTKEKVI